MAKKKIFTILKQVFGLNQDLNAKKQQKTKQRGKRSRIRHTKHIQYT